MSGLDTARAALAEGEAALLGIGERSQLAWLLAQRAGAERLAGDEAAGRPALAKAEALGAELGAGPSLPLGRELAVTRLNLDGWAT